MIIIPIFMDEEISLAVKQKPPQVCILPLGKCDIRQVTKAFCASIAITLFL